MRRAGNSEKKPRGSRQYSRTPVTTYYRTDAGPHRQSPFLRRTPKPSRRRYLVGAADIILIIVLLAVLVYSLLLSGSPSVSASDYSYHSAQAYSRLIKPDFSGLPNRNKITFDEAKIVSRIQSRLPEVSRARVELPFFSEQPKVRLSISPPAFSLKSHGRIYIVDTQGVVVSDTRNSPPPKGLVQVVDESGFVARVGQPVISSESAGFISSVIKQCRRAGVPISNLTLPAIPLEMDLKAADQPYTVKFYLNGDANVETGQFLAARKKFAASHTTPSQYLDVRVEGKVFFK